MATTRDSINWVTAQGEKYQINLAHRNRTHRHTQWAVANQVEVGIFELSTTIGDNSLRWGLYFGGSGQQLHTFLSVLGKDGEYVAKFRGQSGIPWHGYPWQPDKQANDFVPDDVLQNWHQRKCIATIHRRKLQKGHWKLRN